MRCSFLPTICLSILIQFAVHVPSFADDWTNSGGNAQRNGRTTEIGPGAPSPLWNGGRPSIIAWQPVTEGKRVFLVRQTAFPPNNVPNDALIVAMDLDNGAELWAKPVPYNSGDWIPWISGVKNGRVFVSRSGNGGSIAAKMHALDAATGDPIWPTGSQDTTRGGAYDGVVFAPDGDPIVGDHLNLARVNAEDGTTVWRQARNRAVSGDCGAAIFGNAIYIDGTRAGPAQVIERRDLASGAYMYESPLMPGFTEQNWPMVGPDGTVYFSRTQNNAGTDFFYAFTDTGTALVEKWHVPAGWSTSSEFAVGNDGLVYMIGPGRMLQALDPDDGSVVHFYGPLDSDGSGVTPRMAVDSLGRLFVGNGQFNTGRVYSFDPDLSFRWSVAVASVNVGGPVIGANGTLIIAGVGTDVRAFRTPCNPCDANCDSNVDLNDVPAFVDALLGQGSNCSACQANTNADASVDGLDLSSFIDCLLP